MDGCGYSKDKAADSRKVKRVLFYVYHQEIKLFWEKNNFADKIVKNVRNLLNIKKNELINDQPINDQPINIKR